MLICEYRIIKISLSIIAIYLTFNTVVYPQCYNEVFRGEGTFYGYSGGGNCSFPTPYNMLYSAALNAAQYNTAALCGACAEVTGPKGKVIVSLEDQCPECRQGDIDLEQEAFPMIAEPLQGRVPISWHVVPCPVQGPVIFYFKEGSSAYWSAVQIRNHSNPVLSVEYLTPAGYLALPRRSYNYFEAMSGLGSGPFTFRITDIFGDVLIEENIPFIITTQLQGKNQFKACAPQGVDKSQIKSTLAITTDAAGMIFVRNSSAENLDYQISTLLGQILAEGKLLPEETVETSLKGTGIFILKAYSDTQKYARTFCILK